MHHDGEDGGKCRSDFRGWLEFAHAIPEDREEGTGKHRHGVSLCLSRLAGIVHSRGNLSASGEFGSGTRNCTESFG